MGRPRGGVRAPFCLTREGSALLTVVCRFHLDAKLGQLICRERHRVGWSSACGDVAVRITRSKETYEILPYAGLRIKEDIVRRWRVVVLVFVVSRSNGLFLQVGRFLAKSGERYLRLSKPFLQ